jgi:hypothetical protein
MDGDTSTTGQSESATPIDDLVHAVGSTAAQGALDTVTPQLGDLSSAAGANFASGALDQLTTALEPSLPYIIVGVALILLMGIRR